jgi:Protein of unknown function (DUF2637)
MNGNGSTAAGGRPSRGDSFLRVSTAAAVLLVAFIAAVVSFIHIEQLAVTHGQTWLAAVLLPVSIDGTVAAASLVMLRAARRDMGTPWLARTMLGLAVAATLAANIGYGLPYGVPGALLSGWPAVAFVGCAEMAIGMVRRISRAPRTLPESVPAHVPVPAKEPVRKVRETRRVSQATAVKMREYRDEGVREYAAAVKAASNGHGGDG